MPKGKNRHLTLEDRIVIERGICNEESFAAIAREIDVAASTVMREVKRNRHFYVPKGHMSNLCVHRKDCRHVGVCGSGCTLAVCRRCYKVNCNDHCAEFEEDLCIYLERAPYVCGNCRRLANCNYRHAVYRAIYAHESYEKLLVSSREGINLTPDELSNMIRYVKRLLAQGQSFEAICAQNAERVPVSARTLYRYAEAGIFGLANVDLPRKVRYKPRRAHATDVRPCDRDGRSYTDFLELGEEVTSAAWQMDTVHGLARDFKCILTLFHPPTRFQIMVLLDDCTQEAVIGAFDWLEVICEGAFSALFPVILTDRGIEFGDFLALERSAASPRRRCRVFYCDPLRSNQKGACEKNHVELRRCLPKKTSFEELSAYKVAVVASHVNSYPRRSLGGKTPYELAAEIMPKSLLAHLGITRVRPEDVTLTPDVLAGL